MKEVLFGSIRLTGEVQDNLSMQEEDAKLCVRNMESQNRRSAQFWLLVQAFHKVSPDCRLFHCFSLNSPTAAGGLRNAIRGPDDTRNRRTMHTLLSTYTSLSLSMAPSHSLQ